MKRDGKKDGVFALSYIDTRMFKDSDDVEDALMDKVDDMLARFTQQYKDDNKDMSHAKVGLTHKNFAEHMGYETDYKVALARAKKEGKELFIFMSTSYCPWCRKIEKRMLSKTEINKKIQKNYIALKLNFSRKNFPKQFREINLTPTLYTVDPKSEKILGAFVGYSSRDDFLHLLDKK
jgi:thiol-disulfide isomerase/thioredoxin